MLWFLVSQLGKTMRETKFIGTKKRQPPFFFRYSSILHCQKPACAGLAESLPLNLCRLDYDRATKIVLRATKTEGQPTQNLNVEH